MNLQRPKKLNKGQRDSIFLESQIQKLHSVQKKLYLEIREKFKFICKTEGETIYKNYQRARLNAYGAFHSRERALLTQI